MGLDWGIVLLLGVIVVIGSLVQAVVGFGIAVVSAPFVVVLAPDLMPGALLLTSLTLPLVQLARENVDIDRPVLTWALAGRILLMPLGVAIVAWLPATAIAVVVGVMVLVAVAASVWAVEVRPSRGPAFVAGLLTGVSGTAASIGGPFLGLVMQRERPDRIRSTLAVFFAVGATTSLIGLAVAGELTRQQLTAGLVWAPFTVLGLALAMPVRRLVSIDRMRQFVLVLATVAGVGVIVRALMLG